MMAAKIDNKAGKFTGYAAVFIAGWISCGVSYGTLSLTQKAEKLKTVQTQTIPALKAKAGCEYWRAETNEKLALQPQIVKPDQLPLDCPHPKADK